MAQAEMKIGELANATGFTTKTIRYYELVGLLDEPGRTDSGYRVYGVDYVEQLEFIKRAKRLGFSLEEIGDIQKLHRQQQAPCIHVLALLDQKIEQIDTIVGELKEFRRDLSTLRTESRARLTELPDESRICGIIEKGVHARGEAALTWLERRRHARALEA